MNVKLQKLVIRMSKIMIYATVTCISLTMAFAVESVAQRKMLEQIKVDFDLNRSMTLQEVIDRVELETDFTFVYSKKDARKTVLDFESEVMSMEDLLSQISIQAKVSIRRVNESISLNSSSQNTDFPQLTENLVPDVTVSGIVKDESGETLPGVTILEKGTSNGTITAMDGSYTIKLTTSNPVLIISFIGYENQEIPVGNQSEIFITLKEDVRALEEVVVVGYGTQKKADLTGSIASASSEILQERGTTSPVQALQGSVAGVNVSNSTGRVGDTFSFTVRGKSSLGDNNQPLFVVDGVITDNIDFLNPNDIAKIDILKDASSQAIYGSRGSNGVVFIQTKGGANIPSGTNISVDTYTGVKKAARLPKMMSPEKWRRYHYSAYLGTTNNGDGLTEQEFNDVVANPNGNGVLLDRFNRLDGFDWYDAVLQDGMQSNTNVTVNHRNGGSAYSLGIGYQKETGNIENEGLNKFTVRLGMDQEVNDKWKAGAQINISQNTIQRGSEFAMREAFRLNPFLSPWAIDENGNEIEGELFPQPGKLSYPDGSYAANKTSTWNPLLEIANSSDEQRQMNAIGSTYLQFSPFEWLILKSTLSSGYRNYRRGVFFGKLTNTGNGQGVTSSVENFENFNYTLDNQVNLIKSVQKHDFNLLLLQSSFVNRTERSSLSSSNQPFESGFYNVGSGPASTYNLGNSFEKSQLLSYAARVNYTYNSKYFITLSNRWDGSSLLAEGLKWESFPSVAAGWQISEESFMTSTSWLPSLKLRAGYGRVGNNVVAPYSSVSTLDRQTYYDFNGTAANGFVASSLANETLTWETSTESNIGLDFGLFNYRVNGSIDLYNRLTDGQLLERNLPLETGFDNIKANAGEVRNKGVEIALNTVNISTQLISWETSFTFTRNKNTVESLYGEKIDDIGNGWFIGESIDAEYDYKFAGIWQANEESEAVSYNQEQGHVKVEDINNDGKIDPDEDRIVLGSNDPSWTGGITSRLKVGDFDLNISLYTAQDIFVNSQFHGNFINMSDRGRQKLDIPDWYIPTNSVGVESQSSNLYPQPRNTGAFTNALYYKNASYLKIQNISLGYTLPKSLLQKVGIDYTRIYVNVLNPFVFTDYEGWDPEWANADYDVARVSNIITQFGLNLKF